MGGSEPKEFSPGSLTCLYEAGDKVIVQRKGSRDRTEARMIVMEVVRSSWILDVLKEESTGFPDSCMCSRKGGIKNESRNFF